MCIGQLSNPEFNATKNLLPEVYRPLIEKGMMQGGHTRQLKVDVCVGDDDGLVSKQLLERLGLLCNNGDDDGSRDLDFLSNGFKLRLTDSNVNTSGQDYIYMAFAEEPYKFTTAR